MLIIKKKKDNLSLSQLMKVLVNHFSKKMLLMIRNYSLKKKDMYLKQNISIQKFDGKAFQLYLLQINYRHLYNKKKKRMKVMKILWHLELGSNSLI